MKKIILFTLFTSVFSLCFFNNAKAENGEYYDKIVPDYMLEQSEQNIAEESVEVVEEDIIIEDKPNRSDIEEGTEQSLKEASKIKEKKPKKQEKLIDIDTKNFADNVTIQGLDKITAKISNITSPIGEDITFERLTIQVIKCWKAPPDQKPENKALVRITEKTLEDKKKEVFYGWMFSENRSISGLDHPIYDVNIVDCTFNKVETEEVIEK